MGLRSANGGNTICVNIGLFTSFGHGRGRGLVCRGLKPWSWPRPLWTRPWLRSSAANVIMITTSSTANATTDTVSSAVDALMAMASFLVRRGRARGKCPVRYERALGHGLVQSWTRT